MKKIFFLLAISFSCLSNAQIQDSLNSKKLYVKANAVFLPIGILNAGLEYQLNDKMTLQGDVFVSPWKSYMGKYAQVYMVGIDTRYYFNQAFKHFYVGANISAARYIIQKYNYWKDGDFQYTETSPIYNKSDLYQDGYAYFIGATVGYQWEINNNWNLDLYITGGTAQSYYKGFHKTLGVRYDNDPDRVCNKSGEWLPYRGGLMISYRLK